MRLKEIEARLAAIKTELENPDADIDALDREARDLLAEKQRIETRNRLITDISGGAGTPIEARGFNSAAALGGTGTPAPAAIEFDRRTVYSTPEYRNAWAKRMMGLSNNELTENEKRALGVALTTTDTTYSAPTADADGVNNGGLFIPEGVMLDLLERIEKESPIFRDIKKHNIRGETHFPYLKSRSGTDTRDEKEENPDGEREWGELVLEVGEVSETIPVSWRLEAMAVDGFIDYITAELYDALHDKIIELTIYGSGNKQPKGITYAGCIDGAYAAETAPLDAIKAALAKMSVDLKKGAKIYIATDISEDIAFEKDKNGRYMRDPVNGVGINSVARYAVEVDPYLRAGDFIIGNLGRAYKFNWVEHMSVIRTVNAKKRRNEYTSFAIPGGAPVEGAVCYGKKNA